MTVTVKSKRLAIPSEVQRRAGIRPGDRLEFRVSGKIITIMPELPNADDEYTPEQRKALNVQLAEGLEDIRKGRVSPKFDTVDEMLASLQAGTKPARRQSRTRLRIK